MQGSSWKALGTLRSLALVPSAVALVPERRFLSAGPCALVPRAYLFWRISNTSSTFVRPISSKLALLVTGSKLAGVGGLW